MESKTEPGITVHFGIKWLAEPDENPEEIMRWRYRSFHDPMGLGIADIMLGSFHSITPKQIEGVQRDVRIVKDGKILLATPPRPYEEWKYDFLKSDICVVGPIEKEAEARREFEKKKKESLAKKETVKDSIRIAAPRLDELVTKGLVQGIIGRGSFFCKNGYPEEVDDIDFILLTKRDWHSKKGYAEVRGRIVDILKQIPDVPVTIVEKKDTTIKEGKGTAMSFVIVSEAMAKHGKGNAYEKYVLRAGVGIGLPHLLKEDSELLALEFAELLPKRDSRAKIPRLPPGQSAS